MNPQIVNYVSPTRKNRVATLLKEPQPQEKVGRVEPSFWNKVLASKWLGSNTAPLPQGTFTKKGGVRKKLTEYELRALSELSYRSPKVVAMNLKVLKSKKNRKNLTQALNKSKSKTRRRR
jgi:hypothetical protein